MGRYVGKGLRPQLGPRPYQGPRRSPGPTSLSDASCPSRSRRDSDFASDFAGTARLTLRTTATGGRLQATGLALGPEGRARAQGG